MAVKCGTFGIQADLSAVIVSVGGEIGVGFTGKDKETRGYKGGSKGVGTSYGAGGGIEFGLWTTKPKDLAGGSYVIALGAAYVVGVEVQVIFSRNWKFLGFQMTFPNLGMEVEASFSLGSTQVF